MLSNVTPIFQLVAPNGDFDSDLQSVKISGTAESVFLDTYLKDDILESVVIDVTDIIVLKTFYLFYLYMRWL